VSPPNDTPLLEAREVSVRFGGLQALDRASVEVHAGRVTALIGPNGAGKSTLLNVLSGFQPPTGGEVRLEGEPILGRAPHELVARGLARTFQDAEVFGRLTVAENVLLAVPGQYSDRLLGPLLRPGRYRRQKAGHLRRVATLLERTGIADHADELASDLSYGVQKQLILARLLATDARLLMLDEPGAGLPRASVEHLGGLLREIVATENRTVLLIDHNMHLVLSFADYIYVLHHGQVIASGTPAEIRADPKVVEVYLSRPPTDDSPSSAVVDKLVEKMTDEAGAPR
jgi:ABC-type branched-subunit amino acid transport system ATPase component